MRGVKGVGYIPFYIWNNKLPSGNLRDEIINTKACVIVKSKVYKSRLKNIKEVSKKWIGQDGYERRKTTYFTPHGELERTWIAKDNGIWPCTYLFKKAEDYKAIISLIMDYDYIPCYDDFLKDDIAYGDNGLARPATEKSPLIDIIYDIMGIMKFAIEWQDHRAEVLELFNALNTARRKKLNIVAESPAKFVIIDGNIDINTLGPGLINKFCRTAIEEACELLHSKGKMVGLHLDGNNSGLIDIVRELPVDIIESFTPPPDCDLPLEKALELWPGKSFMVNFPSSMHHKGTDAVRRLCKELIDESAKTGKVIIGVSEDVPRSNTLHVVAKTLENYNPAGFGN